MRIFEENGKIRFQLLEIDNDIGTRRILFDFKIKKEHFKQLKEHMIKELSRFELKL